LSLIVERGKLFTKKLQPRKETRKRIPSIAKYIQCNQKAVICPLAVMTFRIAENGKVVA
jgi:hypothetical protein